jgi:hypothetical protein
MKETIESNVSKAILQQPVEVAIGEKTYRVAPPSIATLILVSAAVSKLPKISMDSENIASESLYIAKDCEGLGEIVAILILGAKGLKETKKKFFGLKTVEIDQKSILAKEILSELTPRQLSDMLGKLLAGMELAFFFATTASLIEINLLRKTREAVTTTTASGR